MRIVCDTNVLVSGVLFGGPPRDIVQMALRGSLVIAISPDLLREAEAVLSRPKFKLTGVQVAGMIALFRESFELIYPSRRVEAVAADPQDNIVLEAAEAAGASAIVSGDRHLLDLAGWNGIRIVRPADFAAERERPA